jgi:hypothetical protein
LVEKSGVPGENYRPATSHLKPRRRKTKHKHDTISVRHHSPQTNTNNVRGHEPSCKYNAYLTKLTNLDTELVYIQL